ncbi:MAG: hydrogenase maturation protease [Caldimonas sp.]
MRRTAILGIGSPHGDDRAGWIAIEAFELALPECERAAAGVRTHVLDHPATLLWHLRGVERAILIDAQHGGDQPGTIALVQPGSLRFGAPRASTHGVGVAEVLALGAILQMLPRELTVIGIAVGDCTPDTEVSTPAARAAALVAGRLARWLREGGDVRQRVLERGAT